MGFPKFMVPFRAIRRSRPLVSSRSSVKQADRRDGPGEEAFVVPGPDLVLDLTLLKAVDRLEDVAERVGVGGDERPAAGDVGQVLKQGEVRPLGLGDHGEVGLGVVAVDDPACFADGDRVQRHPEVAGQLGGAHGVERVGHGRLVVAVGQEDQDLLRGSRPPERVERPGERVADVGAVVARPGRPHGLGRFDQEPMVERRRAGEIGIVGEDDQADQVVLAPLDEPAEASSRAASRRLIWRVPASAGKSTVFMLELWSTAATIATPFAAIRITPPTVCGRARATTSAPIARHRSSMGSRCRSAQGENPASRRRKPARLGQVMPPSPEFANDRQQHEDQEDRASRDGRVA